MKKYYDLSFSIKDSPSCTFQVDELKPQVLFTQAVENNLFLVNTRIDNLRMDASTHVLSHGCLPDVDKKNNFIKFQKDSIDQYIGEAFILDISFLYEPIKHFFDEKGILKIDLENEYSCKEYIQALDEIMLTKKTVFNTLVSQGLLLENIQGLLLYTGLSEFWQYKKFEAWEYIYFLGLEFSQDLTDWLLSSKLAFIGIDTLKFGHTFFNFSGLEKLFICSKSGRDFFTNRLKVLRQQPTKYTLLSNGIKLYQSLNINSELANERGEFIGLPLAIDTKSFNNISLTRPILRMR